MSSRRPEDDSLTPSARAWRRYLRFWGPRVGDDVDDELSFHIDMRARDFQQRGLDSHSARVAAVRRFGNVDQLRRDCLTIDHRQERRMTRTLMLEAFLQDLRYALRTLGRQRAWTATAIITLGVGIGASTTVFSVVDSLLLHPLPYPNADRVVNVRLVEPKSRITISADDDLVAAWRARARAIESMAQYVTSGATLVDGGDPMTVSTASVGTDFQEFTALPPHIGRSFAADEIGPVSAHVAVLSDRLWRTRFGAAPDIVGKPITLGAKTYQIIGVADSHLVLPGPNFPRPDVWLPATGEGHERPLIIRLRPGYSLDAARRELQAIADTRASSAEQKPSSYRVRLTRPEEQINFRDSLELLSVAVTLLLIIAGANVAHLLLARGATRERELAVRAAIGAGRGRLLRQLLTENLLLALAGSALGIVIAAAGVRALLAFRPATLTPLDLTQLGARVIVTASVAAVAVGMAFGLIAAFHAIRRASTLALRVSSFTVSGTHRLRSVIVVTEMAMSALLLVGATLVVRSVIQLQHVDPGFDAANLYSVTIRLPASRYASPAQRTAFAVAVAERARSIGGVRAVTVAAASPALPVGLMFADLESEGVTTISGGYVSENVVGPDFFRTTGMRLVDGRTFDGGASARREAIINEGLARRLWPGQSALGRRMRYKNGGGSTNIEPWMTVVGVAANVPIRGLADDVGAPMVYQPVSDNVATTTVLLRVVDGVNPAAAVRAIIRSLDPGMVPPPAIRAEDMMLDSIASQRFTMLLLGAFASVAMLMAAVGLFGVVSHMVTQRTKEIGLRIALGAVPLAVARSILWRGLALSTAGLAAGGLLSLWGTRLIEHSLFGVSSGDAASYLITGGALTTVSIVACLAPVRRAMTVDLVAALRGD
jgi:putative ABC transport system permease protein